MPTYQVVFTNGEKRDLTVEANSIDYAQEGMIRFLRQGESKGTPVAVVPVDRVLYVIRTDES